jgi:hypothetical protein
VIIFPVGGGQISPLHPHFGRHLRRRHQSGWELPGDSRGHPSPARRRLVDIATGIGQGVAGISTWGHWLRAGEAASGLVTLKAPRASIGDFASVEARVRSPPIGGSVSGLAESRLVEGGCPLKVE